MLKVLSHDFEGHNLQLILFSCAIIFLCTASLLFRFELTERIPFVVDELVDTQIASQITKKVKIYSDLQWERTPLMNYIIGFATDSAKSSFDATIKARKVMWLGTVIICIFTFLISRKAFDTSTALLSLFLLCGFTTFLDRSIRVRADLISTLFSMPALLILSSPNLIPASLLLAGAFLGLATLSTQKAIYFIIAFAVALAGRTLFISGISKGWLKSFSKNISIIFAGYSIPVSIFTLWIIFSGEQDAFFKNCLLRAANIGLTADTYARTWPYLWQSILRNPAFWILGLTGSIFLLFDSIRNRREVLLKNDQNIGNARHIAISIWSITLFLLLMRHKVKFPYLFLNIAPSLAICGSSYLRKLLVFFYDKGTTIDFVRLTLRVTLFFFLILIPIWHHKVRFSKALMTHQKTIMDRVDQITTPNDTIFDGIGMATTRKKATPYSITERWLDERKAGAPYDIISNLKTSEPKVLIWNYRMHRLNQEEINFLSKNFTQDWANIYVVGYTIVHSGPKETTSLIDFLSSSEYAILAEDINNIRIDNKKVSSVQFINSGIHKIEIDKVPQRVVIKYYPSIKFEPPKQVKLFGLFPSYAE